MFAPPTCEEQGQEVVVPILGLVQWHGWQRITSLAAKMHQRSHQPFCG